jgi:hypothetical protein
MFNSSEPTKKFIKVLRPRPQVIVGGKILILGKISKSLLSTKYGMDTTIFLDIVGLDGKNWRSGSDFNIKFWPILKYKKSIWFSTVFYLYRNDIPWIQKSKGLLNLKFSTREHKHLLYIPIKIKGFEFLGAIDSEQTKKHEKMGEIINQYEKDLLEWEKEMEILRLGNANKVNVTETDDWMTEVDIDDDELLKKLLGILSTSNSDFEEKYKFAKQAQAERMLAEKYKDAIEWRGPLFRGAVKQWRGFIFKVHSDDHGKHFHVIHAEKGIDARISFPEIEIIDYKLKKKKISSKEEKAIKHLFNDSALYAKLEGEFKKREA